MITAQELLRGPKMRSPKPLAASVHVEGNKKRVADYIDSLPSGVWFSGNGIRRLLGCHSSTVSEVIAERNDLEKQWSFKKRAYGWVKV